MDNYQFCHHWVVEQKPTLSARVLDYGCGDGRIVSTLRAEQINAFGCDIFYEGGNAADSTFNEFIKKMNNTEIPFESESFDFIVNNQVIEHVLDLDCTLAEFCRVLKPGGRVLSIFPDKSVWREGHSGIPFLHWFPRHNHIRVYYAAAFRMMGFGKHMSNRTVLQWAQHKCDWLDQWTHYRNPTKLLSNFEKHFCDTQHIEAYWFRKRFQKRMRFIQYIPNRVLTLLSQKLAGFVIVSTK